ncbi:hypothetical protein FACS189445_2950 [Spirochaetia bacterium]|nr:hypothetical protein FACS189445_2950 [Spirochaetia bacterium]
MPLFSGLFTADHRSDTAGTVWTLLNDTALLLNRTAIEDRFAGPLGMIRSRLQQAPANPAVLAGVNEALVELRKQMRLCGYDLSMGKYTLIFDGFRNDDAMARGFVRMVLFIERNAFYWRTGEANHVALAGMLEQYLDRAPHRDTIIGKHYLWYLKTKTTLTLSGAATEAADDYRKLKAQGEADSLLFLSKLRDLK